MQDSSFQVELFFSGRNLKDLDFFSKSDPFLELHLQKSLMGNIEKAGRTETVKDSVNPNWKNKITVQYYFEMRQPVVVEIYDDDGSGSKDFIGKGETTMGNIMGSHMQTLILDIKNDTGKLAGKVIIRAEKIEDSSHNLNMKWKGTKIANVDSIFDFWDKSDPYLKFLKIREDNTFVEIGRTVTKHECQEPSWPTVSLPASRLLNLNHPTAAFKVQCWDEEEGNKPHQFIGECYVPASDIKTRQAPIEYKMTSTKIKKPGLLVLEDFKLVPTPNFIDYLKSGLQLNLVVAIDFTGSNGVPSSSTSLHYVANQPTQYQKVMKGIWEVIENYDSDKKIPAFGFGAKPHFPRINCKETSHCFPINDNPDDPEIRGFDNLMNSYVNAVKNMEFSGPTFFAPLLKEAFAAASRLLNSFSYQILLILTDGQIHDMAATKDLIVQKSNLPISIIIVGIGNADFTNMVELDGDGNGLFDSQGRKCPRDIVQFVPFNKYNGDHQVLTAEILREIPKQTTQYFTMIGRLPQPVQAPSLQHVAPSKSQNISQVIFNQHN